MLQEIIIALAVATAATYVVWTFAPMARRQRWLDALAAHGILVEVAAKHRARLMAPGCGNCPAAGAAAPRVHHHGTARRSH